MDGKRIRQVAKISGVSEEIVKTVFTAELLRASRELIKSKREWVVGIYGEMFPKSPSEVDVCETKMNQEFLDIVEGNINPEIMESI